MLQGRRRALCLEVVLVAVTAPAQAERLPIKAYTTDDGLAHNDVRRIDLDSRGFLWFCRRPGCPCWMRQPTIASGSRPRGGLVELVADGERRHRVSEKLQVHSKTEAVAKALRERRI